MEPWAEGQGGRGGARRRAGIVCRMDRWRDGSMEGPARASGSPCTDGLQLCSWGQQHWGKPLCLQSAYCVQDRARPGAGSPHSVSRPCFSEGLPRATQLGRDSQGTQTPLQPCHLSSQAGSVSSPEAELGAKPPEPQQIPGSGPRGGQCLPYDRHRAPR